MKKSFVLFFAMCLTIILSAQVKFGIKAGLNTLDLNPKQLVVTDMNDVKDLGLSIKDAKYGIQLGVFTEIGLGKFFIQPEVLFNSNTVDFDVEDFSNSSAVNKVLSETYQFVDIPLIMGLKVGPLKLGAGPVSHVFVNSKSELFNLDGYEQKFKDMTWGWQAGVGVNLWKLMLDVRYEGNFNKFGDHINFHNMQFNFDKTPGRFIATVGISF
ncbi:MAG TPA: PorT family protein [Saprospiraceae bacterium]|nr:PorT family protein [Saprospiraceae bacterium]